MKAEESKAPEATAAASPASAAPSADNSGGAPPGVALSLACFGCGRLPSEMGDGREKHPVCPICRELKIPTTYWCDVNCPGNPDAWKRHTPVHKEVRRQRKRWEDGGVGQQCDSAERNARIAARSGDAYDELVAKQRARGTSLSSDMRRAARALASAPARQHESIVTKMFRCHETSVVVPFHEKPTAP